MNTAIARRDAKWERAVSKISPELADPVDYPRILQTLIWLTEGKSWSEIAPTGLSRPEYIMLRRRSKEFLALAKEAEAIADDIRQSIREEEAHKRAVEGETIPVYTVKGTLAGTYQKRSDRLMELLLRANNPEKYRESRELSGGPGRVVLNVNFAIPSRVKKEKVIEGEAHVIEEKEALGGSATPELAANTDRGGQGSGPADGAAGGDPAEPGKSEAEASEPSGAGGARPVPPE